MPKQAFRPVGRVAGPASSAIGPFPGRMEVRSRPPMNHGVDNDDVPYSLTTRGVHNPTVLQTLSLFRNAPRISGITASADHLGTRAICSHLLQAKNSPVNELRVSFQIGS